MMAPAGKDGNKDLLPKAVEVYDEEQLGQHARRLAKEMPNAEGVSGVCWHKGKRKWRAEIVYEKRQITLGCFDVLAEAIERRLTAEKAKAEGKNPKMPRVGPKMHPLLGGPVASFSSQELYEHSWRIAEERPTAVGVEGACWDKAKRKWKSIISTGGTQLNLGLYHNLADAIERRLLAEKAKTEGREARPEATIGRTSMEQLESARVAAGGEAVPMHGHTRTRKPPPDDEDGLARKPKVAVRTVPYKKPRRPYIEPPLPKNRKKLAAHIEANAKVETKAVAKVEAKAEAKQGAGGKHEPKATVATAPTASTAPQCKGEDKAPRRPRGRPLKPAPPRLAGVRPLAKPTPAGAQRAVIALTKKRAAASSPSMAAPRKEKRRPKQDEADELTAASGLLAMLT